MFRIKALFILEINGINLRRRLEIPGGGRAAAAGTMVGLSREQGLEPHTSWDLPCLFPSTDTL